MSTTQMTLWQAVDQLAAQAPFTTNKVEAVLLTRLKEVDSNRYTAFWESGRIDLAHGCQISKADLRLGLEPGGAGFLVLWIAGDCISLVEVRARYGELKLTGHPRGRSLDEQTTYTAAMPWGELSFGFKERNPGCLASVVLDPKK